MLETLRIKNIAIIDEAEVSFKQGLNILSGETGAGKSIIIEAISLILGSRAQVEMIRAGSDEGVVEGLFDVSSLDWISERLERLGFDSKVSELLIKRVVNRSGRHRIYINGELATLSLLQDLCEGLVDLCGQHEHQSLVRPAIQTALLDRFGGLEKEADVFQSALVEFRTLKQELEILKKSEDERARRIDFLNYQIQELRNAELQEGEDESLQVEKKLLQSAEQRLALASQITELVESENNEFTVLDLAKAASAKIRALSNLDPSAESLNETLARAMAEVEELSHQLGRYRDSIQLDSDRMAQVQERLALLADLRRKYGDSVETMLRTLAELEQEFEKIHGSDRRVVELTTQLSELETKLSKTGKKLFDSRVKTGKLLGDSVTAELQDLKMADAQFQADLKWIDDVARWSPQTGPNEIHFLARTNKGESVQAIEKIASGGELSRMTLAIRRVISSRGGIGVYLFDEIDAGIGGQTAFQVGKKLKAVSEHNQVICITHLPQVASFADHHMIVEKVAKGGRTLTRISELKREERKEEIARMLGGPSLTRSSLQNAAELLKMAR